MLSNLARYFAALNMTSSYVTPSFSIRTCLAPEASGEGKLTQQTSKLWTVDCGLLTTNCQLNN